MLPRVNRATLIKRLCVVTALAGAALCALEGLPDAAAGADGGEQAAPTATPEVESGPRRPGGIPGPACCRAAASVAGNAWACLPRRTAASWPAVMRA